MSYGFMYLVRRMSIFVTAFLIFGEVIAETAAGVDATIGIVKSPEATGRVEAAKSLADSWPKSLPTLTEQIDSYYQTGAGPPYEDEDIPTLVVLTDVVRTIVVNKKGGIQAFRKVDTDNTIKLLTWASRGPHRSLRLNATYILANVVDNTNLCIILDHLRDPELGPNGMVNLLQVAISVASYAYKENVEATMATVDILSPRVANTGSGKIDILVDILSRRVGKSKNAEVLLPPALWLYCRDYNYAATSP